MDKLSLLLGHHAFHARTFFVGDFCDANDFRHNGRSGHLHVVRQGPVQFVHDSGDIVNADVPAVVFYPTGMSHRLQVPSGSTASLLCADITFDHGTDNLLARVLPPCVHIPLADIAGLAGTLEMLFAEASSCAAGRELVLDRLCDVLLIRILRHELDSGCLSPELMAGLADGHLALALAAIHERPHESWTLARLADVAGMSRASFAEHFRTVMGTPPGEYLTRWRMSHAAALLRQGLPVKQVSARAGYDSPAAFTRAFTASMGASPRAWSRLAAEAATGPSIQAAPA